MSRTVANAVDLPKHNGNGDNRFAILIEGSKGDIAFDRSQFRGDIQEMGLMLTEHHNNTKPGPGYTGYYLQDQIYYIGVHDNFPVSNSDFPYLERDKEVTSSGTTGKENILRAIQDVARKADSYDKVMLFYTAYGGNIGLISYFDANTDGTFLSNKDIKADELDKYLDTIECKDMVIILQPDYSGDWITPLEQDSSGGITTYETNRVIITSEQSGQTAELDKCNMEPSEFENPSPPPDQIKVEVYYIGTGSDDDEPIGDGEEYQSTPGGQWMYQVNKYEDSPHENLYEIDVSSGNFLLDFYENWNDFGAEFVSGFTEAYYTDLFDEDDVDSNDILDADEYTINGFNGYSHFPSITGDDNDYISCKEAYNYMKLWHLGYRLNTGPWIDTPQIEYTQLEDGTVYLY